MKSESIGFIGVGNVGSNLANNLLKSNNNVFVYDKNNQSYSRLKNLKNKPCKTLKELTEKSDIIITCLPSPKAVSKVLKTILEYLTKKHIWIEMSTTDKNDMISLSKKVTSKGGKVLECPITGGEHRAKSGNISILAAGKKSTFKKCFPILSLLGHEILYCGKIGNASILKVITNYLASLHLVGIGEALSVAKKNKIDLGLTYKAIKISSGNSFVNETETKVILGGSYDVGFTMDLVNKDINLFNKLGKNIKLELGNYLSKKFKLGMKILGASAAGLLILNLIPRFKKAWDLKNQKTALEDTDDIKNLNNQMIKNSTKLGTLASAILDKKLYEKDRVVNVITKEELTNKNFPEAINFSRKISDQNKKIYQHLGIYCYQKETLKNFVSYKKSSNEQKYKLEQYRALENNIKINVALAKTSPIGVDTEEDFLAIKKIMEYKLK